mgnify:CR=1 FL=1
MASPQNEGGGEDSGSMGSLSSGTPSPCSPGSPGSTGSLIDTPPASPVANGHGGSSSKPQGPRFKLLHEGDIQVCRLNHTRTIVSKIMNSKYLRRWESHRLMLGTTEITSSTVGISVVC